MNLLSGPMCFTALVTESKQFTMSSLIGAYNLVLGGEFDRDFNVSAIKRLWGCESMARRGGLTMGGVVNLKFQKLMLPNLSRKNILK